MPGYSGTPLPKKLGIKPGLRVQLVAVPADVQTELRDALTVLRNRARPQGRTRRRHAIHQVAGGAEEGVCPVNQAARARWDALGELAEEEFRRRVRSGREGRARNWPVRRISRC